MTTNKELVRQLAAEIAIIECLRTNQATFVNDYERVAAHIIESFGAKMFEEGFSAAWGSPSDGPYSYCLQIELIDRGLVPEGTSGKDEKEVGDE